jgi:hypothetical protein
MTRPIEAGDTISVVWGIGGEWHSVTVVSMPADTGDLLYVHDEQGRVYGINTNAADLCWIVKKDKDDPGA